MASYKSASYQQDVINQIVETEEVYLYGPGYEFYNISDTIDDIILKSSFEPDVIILGHAWLSDKDGDDRDPHPNLQLNKSNIFKVVIFNKEYTNLEHKIKFVKENKFNIGFTHHHDLSLFNKTKTPFLFWPFAYDSRKFTYHPNSNNIDIGFSGILQNLNKNASQSDTRAKIMNLFYYSFFDVPINKKNKFKELNIYWNSISRSTFGRYLSILLNKRKYLSDDEYSNLIQNSKIFINTLSPMGLISPRFFECMGSGTLVFCENSKLYNNIFPNDIYVSFNSDLSDFIDKIMFYQSAQKERKKITKKAYEFVSGKHTWENRVNDMIYAIKGAMKNV